ncbi:hypothetical protein [Clostridium sp.]|uniref:hypothetical protein n=1 Tax=Clostridium sp. TaxID=1506 RepID=UPI002A9160B3|nr:hypothetical protein [Clostridium sp.]MDY6011325.1 hypothetical protein [Clostridium sp.]
MKKRITKLLITGIMLVVSSSMVGCTPVNDIAVKFGFKNDDFNYMKTNKVDEIIIQNTRDSGFRFKVTDQKAIEDIYNALASGNPKSAKSSLDADYIFEIHCGDEIKKYKYVVGVDESGKGNFYDDEKAYKVPKNLDQTIINNLSFIRRPREFNSIYYGTIMTVLDMNKDQLINPKYKVGINMQGDLDCVKYLFSVELQQFQKELQKVIPGAGIISNNNDEYNVIVTVQNKGYDSETFRTLITIDNKLENTSQKYYVVGHYEFKKWEITVGKDGKKPENW